MFNPFHHVWGALPQGKEYVVTFPDASVLRGSTIVVDGDETSYTLTVGTQVVTSILAHFSFDVKVKDIVVEPPPPPPPTGNAYFASNGSTMLFEPHNYPPVIYIPSLDTTLFGWEAGTGTNPGRRAECRNFDHGAGEWSDNVICDSRGLSGDDHGPPCFTMDHQGYVHVFSGAHTSPIRHSRTTNPATTVAELSSWTQLSDWFTTGITINGPYGASYPHVVSIGNKIYMVYRTSDGHQGASTNFNMWANIRVGTFNNGGITWGNEVVVMAFGLDSRCYMLQMYLRGDEIWLSATKSNGNVSQNENCYVLVFNTVTGKIRNPQNTFSVGNWLTPTGSSTPLINKASADANFRVAATSGNGGPLFIFHDSAGNFYQYWGDSAGYHESRLAAGATTFTHASTPIRINVAWQNPTTGLLQGLSDAASATQVKLASRSSGGAWTAGAVVQQQQRAYPLWNMMPVLMSNGAQGSHAHARAVFEEIEGEPTAERGDLRGYCYGDAGLLLAP